jgi:NAD(P)H dehydrogenase (quinone)
VARTPDKAKHLGVEVRKGDYNNLDEFKEAFKDVNKVLLVSGMDEPDKRIQQHRNVINAAKFIGVDKIVYTSIIGDEEKSAFSPIVKSNRQTEEDVRNSGMQWAIGRNGIYIEPDLEYIENYKKAGEIRNSGGLGKCAYTSRRELGLAYAKMLLDDSLNGETYNLVGEPFSQSQLAHFLNEVYGTNLHYSPLSIDQYTAERKDELGDFLGTVIGGIYASINNGAYNILSDYERVVGRPHKAPLEMIKEIANKTK